MNRRSQPGQWICFSLQDGEEQKLNKILALLQLSKPPHLTSDQKLDIGDNSEGREVHEVEVQTFGAQLTLQ